MTWILPPDEHYFLVCGGKRICDWRAVAEELARLHPPEVYALAILRHSKLADGKEKA